MRSLATCVASTYHNNIVFEMVGNVHSGVLTPQKYIKFNFL